MITKFRELSGKSLIKDEHSLWYHIQDGTFQETKWLAIENGYNNGLSFKQIISKLRVNYNKSSGFEEYDWTQEPHESWEELIKNHAHLKELLLVKQSRLSVMPIDTKSWKMILNMGRIQ